MTTQTDPAIPADPAAASATGAPARHSTPRPASLRLQRAFFAACLILGPALMVLSVVRNPARTVDSNDGSAVIAAHIAAGTGLSAVDFFIFVVHRHSR